MSDSIESILNDLIETSKDGERGFTKSAADTKNAELKAVFTQAAQRCSESAHELQALSRSQGGNPAKTGSVAAALHRGWVSLREAVAGDDDDDEAILEECERGEDYAKAQYRKALDRQLPYVLREVVERQYRGVVANHDQVQVLRDRYRVKAEAQ